MLIDLGRQLMTKIEFKSMNDIALDQLLLSQINESDATVQDHLSEPFKYSAVFLNRVEPDDSNPRHMPAIMISDEHASLFVRRQISKQQLLEIYDGVGKVLVGKQCMINCSDKSSPDWKKANESIESVIELAQNLAVSEIIQVPTIYPVDNGQYRILTGHRRFFALIYCKGCEAAAQFKIYRSPPLLKKVKQFQENASREDLPQYGKLLAFLSAENELESVSNARLRMGKTKLTVRERVNILGISMGAYDNYRVLTRYPCVLRAYENRLSLSFIHVKKLILSVESEYRRKHDDKQILNVTDKRSIDSELEALLSENKPEKSVATPKFKLKPLTSEQALLTLLRENILSLDIGLDWDKVNWKDEKDAKKVLDQVIDFLEQMSP